MWWYWIKVIYLAIAGTVVFWLMNRTEKIGFTEVLAGVIVGIFWPICLVIGWIKALKKQ